MKQPTAGSNETSAGRVVCTACPLLCDDILIAADGVERACGPGTEAIRDALVNDMRSAETASAAWENDRLLDRGEAITNAATMLTSSRRVLVTGLADTTLESITAACDLAERLGAAIDAGLPESARAAGPTIARAGEVTAAFEELRDRADLVIFWCCDPTESHPRFIERFVSPTLADDRPRRTIAVGQRSILPDASTHRHLPLAHDRAVEAARWLQMRIAGRHAALTDTPFSATCGAVEEAIQSADCVAIITNDADDPVGLEAWSVVHLVRTIAHEKHAFRIPLGAGLSAGVANGAGAAATCTWRYGAAGAIAHADRLGSLFLPGESDARRLIDRGEVDAVVVIGRLSPSLEQAIADRGDSLSLVRISDAAQMARKPAGRSITLRCANRMIATTGAMLREDGHRIVLAPHRRASLPQMRDLLVDLTAAVRQAMAAPSGGGRP